MLTSNLQAGYNLDSLMMRYQGVDWRDPAFWQCNAGCVHAACKLYKFPCF